MSNGTTFPTIAGDIQSDENASSLRSNPSLGFQIVQKLGGGGFAKCATLVS